MVCSPHRYIVSNVAAGGFNYASDTFGIPYKRPVYSNRYQEPLYETKKQTPFEYARQTDIPDQIQNISTPYYYTRSPTSEKLPTDAEILATPPIRYRPLSLISPNIQHVSHITEASMTDQQLRQTKQKLAQRIMQELDSLGPREEHVHEHGENTHVH